MKPSTSALPGLLFPDPQQKAAASLEILFCCLSVKQCHWIRHMFLDMQINIQVMLSLKPTEMAQNFAAK